MPYIALIAALAATVGGAAALAAWVGSLLWIFVGTKLVTTLIPGVPAFFLPLTEVPAGARYGAIVMSIAAVAVVTHTGKLHAGFIRARQREEEAASEVHTSRIEAQALEASLRTTMNRMATERTTMTILAEQLKRLQSFDQNEVYQATLSSVRLLTGATSCVIYRFHEEHLKLERTAVWPARHAERYALSLPVASSLEGHVVRTGALFSLRQLVEHPQLRSLDQNNTVICVPVVVRNRTWGVLTIGRIPFLKYTEYAEKALQVTAALAAPALENALPMVSVERDGVPLNDSADSTDTASVRPFEELRKHLESTLVQAERLDYQVSMLLVELSSALDFDGQLALSSVVGNALGGVTGNSTTIFHYQSPNQIVLVTVSTGVEATGYLLLRITELVTGQAWTVDEETVLPEAVVGFATSTTCGYDADQFFRRSEQILALQRQEFGPHV